MTAPTKILVTGASGNVGGALLGLLRAEGRGVRALVRDRNHPSLPPDADVAVADLDEPKTVAAAAAGVSAVFLLGGRRDMPGLLAEFRSAGIEHVVLLTSRSVIGGVRGNAIVDMWTSSEAAVRESGMSWTILRPSGFMSNALRWLPQLQKGDIVRAPFADAPIAAIDPADIAAIAAAELTERAHVSQALELSGPSALLPETQVEILGRVLGRDLRFERQSNDEARGELARLFPPAFVDALFRFFVGGEFDDSPVVRTVHEIVGRSPRSFDQWAAAHASEF